MRHKELSVQRLRTEIATHHTSLTSSYKLVETKDILSRVTKFKAIAEYIQDVTQEKLLLYTLKGYGKLSNNLNRRFQEERGKMYHPLYETRPPRRNYKEWSILERPRGKPHKS